MSITQRLALAAVGGMLSIAGCATTTSQQLARNLSAGQRCEDFKSLDQRVQKLLSAHSIARVEPAFHEVPHFAGPSPLFVEGAEIYIVADADTNEAYVERTLSCHAAVAATQAQAHDPFHVSGVRSISAQSAGPTIRVSIRGIDREAGEEIWRRTQALRGVGSIHIQQLGAADHPPGL
jgi:hypothetical protein